MPKALRKKLQTRTARFVFTFIFVIVLATWAFTTTYRVEYTTTAFGPGPRGDITRVSGFSIGSGVFSFGWGLAMDWEEFDKLTSEKSQMFDLGLIMPYLAFANPYIVLRVPFWLIALAAAIPMFLCWRKRTLLGPELRCTKCSYLLTGNKSGICPECGARTLHVYHIEKEQESNIGATMASRENTRFIIDLDTNIEFSMEPETLQSTSSSPDDWRILDITLERNSKKTGIWTLTIYIHPDDISPTNYNKIQLYEFRDTAVGLVALATLNACRRANPGLFDIHMGGKLYRTLLLGESGTVGLGHLSSLTVLLHASGITPKGRRAVTLFALAINSHDVLEKFLHVAMLYELLASDSPEGRSRVMKCRNSVCGTLIEQCPKCNKPLPKAPESLRRKLAFLVPEESLLNKFLDARNRIFHGGAIDGAYLEGLTSLNSQLLFIGNNYLAAQFGMGPLEINPDAFHISPYSVLVTDSFKSED